METAILTLTPEILNEFEIQRENKELIINQNFEAIIKVKVGNIVDEISFKWKNNYISNYSGNYYNGKEISKEELQKIFVLREDDTSYWDISFDRKGAFRQLEDAGVEIDWTNIREKYLSELIVWKRLRRKEISENRGKKWDKSWVHDFMKNFNEQQNKKLSTYKDYKVEICPTRELFKKSSHEPLIRISYKEKETSVKYVYSDRTNDYSYEWSHTVSNDKVRRAKIESTSVLKFLEYTDEYISKNEAKKSRAEKEEQDRNDLCARMKETFGMNIKIEKRWKNYHGSRTRREGFYVYEYFVEIPQFRKPTTEEQMKNDLFETKKQKGEPITHKIVFNGEGSYNRNSNTYDLAGLYNLSESQVKTILSVL